MGSLIAAFIALGLIVPTPVHAEVATTPNTVFCSCIKTARYIGLNLPPAPYAGDYEPNTNTPEVMDGILLSYQTDEHIAVILRILSTGFWIAEGNYERCEYTERFIDFDDYHIRGFYTTSYDNYTAQRKAAISQ